MTLEIAGVEGADAVHCMKDTKIKPDEALHAVKDHEYDVIILPGGNGGAKAFSAVGIRGVHIIFNSYSRATSHIRSSFSKKL